MQFGEIFMDPDFCFNYSDPDESDTDFELILPRIPKGFKLNHQSDGNSVSFWVGREFPKLLLCFAFHSVLEKFHNVIFVVSTNSFSKEAPFCLESAGATENLCLTAIDPWGWDFEWEWEVSNPSEENLLTIVVKTMESREGICYNSDPQITWLGVQVDCICCGCGSSSVSDDIVSVSDDIDHHSSPSDGGLQLDNLGSSSMARICDNTDLDHGVFNNGGVSGHLIEPNFESTFPGDVLDSHDSDSESFVNPFASIEYNDLHDSDLSSFVNPSASIGYNNSDAGEHWLLRFLKTPPFTILFQCFR